jgi:FkbM family methyltransferase
LGIKDKLIVMSIVEKVRKNEQITKHGELKDKIMFSPRPNTQDQFIINEVYENNCYKLPGSLKGITIIDIGANIGAFVAACVERDVERVIAFEPERENFDKIDELCLRNNWNNVRRFEGAVIGRTNRKRFAYLSNGGTHGDVKLTGGCRVSNQGKIPVPLFSIDQAMEMSGKNTTCDIWIKLDCEGSEHEIVKHIGNNSRIKQIFGEVHTTIENKMSRDTEKVDFELPSHEQFVSELCSLGFEVEFETNPVDPCLALFWAMRG